MTREIENNQVEHDISHVPTKEQLQGIEPLEACYHRRTGSGA